MPRKYKQKPGANAASTGRKALTLEELGQKIKSINAISRNYGIYARIIRRWYKPR